MNSLVDHYKGLAGRLHDSALDNARTFRFEKNHPWHLGLVTLYGTVIELHGSICLLMNNSFITGAPIILRSALEATLDIVNLAKDAKYGYRMRATELKEKIKILKASRSCSNPFFEDIAKDNAVPSYLADYQAELDGLKAQGYEPLKQHDKFEIAQEQNIYQSIYPLLCCEAHVNPMALKANHVRNTHNDADFGVEFYASIDILSLLFYLDCACQLTLFATEAIYNAFNISEPTNIKAYKQELDMLRKC